MEMELSSQIGGGGCFSHFCAFFCTFISNLPNNVLFSHIFLFFPADWFCFSRIFSWFTQFFPALFWLFFQFLHFLEILEIFETDIFLLIPSSCCKSNAILHIFGLFLHLVIFAIFSQILHFFCRFFQKMRQVSAFPPPKVNFPHYCPIGMLQNPLRSECACNPPPQDIAQPRRGSLEFLGPEGGSGGDWCALIYLSGENRFQGRLPHLCCICFNHSLLQSIGPGTIVPKAEQVPPGVWFLSMMGSDGSNQESRYTFHLKIGGLWWLWHTWYMHGVATAFPKGFHGNFIIERFLAAQQFKLFASGISGHKISLKLNMGVWQSVHSLTTPSCATPHPWSVIWFLWG